VCDRNIRRCARKKTLGAGKNLDLESGADTVRKLAAGCTRRDSAVPAPWIVGRTGRVYFVINQSVAYVVARGVPCRDQDAIASR